MDNAGDNWAKAQEATARREAGGQVGAMAVAQPAAGGRRGPRIRRSASARRRARERAGLDGAGEVEAGEGEAGLNPEELEIAEVEMQQFEIEDEVDDTLGFWQLDKTDKYICGAIACLVIFLVIVLVVAMTT